MVEEAYEKAQKEKEENEKMRETWLFHFYKIALNIDYLNCFFITHIIIISYYIKKSSIQNYFPLNEKITNLVIIYFLIILNAF